MDRASNLYSFLLKVLPERIPSLDGLSKVPRRGQMLTRQEFVDDVKDGMSLAPMSTRLTPHILSMIDWARPLEDPLRRQFIPMKSFLVEDHPRLSLDSLNEVHDSPVQGLVHRYPDKALFLG